MSDHGTVTEQHDVRTPVPEVPIRGESQGCVLGGTGVRTHHDVGITSTQLLPVLLINSWIHANKGSKIKLTYETCQAYIYTHCL